MASRKSPLVLLAALLALPYVAGAEPAASPGPAAAIEDETGVLRLFDEFVSSGAAASRCAQPDDDTAAHFLSNFQWVSSHAALALKRQLPEERTGEAVAELARRSGAVKDRTHELVKSEGCGGSSVQELVRRFAIQAAWRREG
jgi:hypothetical protein